MGAKITIDSATLANKGLEVIEARWLYDVAYEAIDVVIHPQSVVHSAVQFVDGSLKAQLGTPDMRLPIQYALTYPDRRPSPAAAPDLVALARLDFRAPDEARFPALRIAREAGRLGPRATAALIAADDVAVARFLDGTLDFPGIPRLLEDAVARFGTRAGRRSRTSTSWSPSTARSARVARGARRRGERLMDGVLFALLAFVLFIVVLGGLVLVHELGHYLTARRSTSASSSSGSASRRGRKVLRSKGETLWTLNWLPIGGFVRMDGEDGDGADDPRSFSAKPLRVRLAILVAGVAHEHRPGVRDLLRHRLAGDARRSASKIGDGRGGLAGRDRRARSPATRSTRVDGEPFEIFGGATVVDALRGHAGETGHASSIRRADGAARTSPPRSGRRPSSARRAARSASQPDAQSTERVHRPRHRHVGRDRRRAGRALGRPDHPRPRRARRRVHQGPDRAAARVRARSASPSRSPTIFLDVGPDRDAATSPASCRSTSAS